MSILKLGINDYISNEDYHADTEFISSSGLKLMHKDPRKFHKEYVMGERQSFANSAALDFGSYLHCAILEPHLLDKEFAVFQGIQRRGGVFKEFEKQHEGKVIITNVQAQKAQQLLNNFYDSNVVIGEQGNDKEVSLSSFYSGGYAEQTVTAVINGVKVKVRSDYRKEFEDFGSINDIKTTGDIIDSIHSARRVCDIWGYHISAALYVDVFTAVTGKPHDFYFTFLSKANGEVRMYKASEEMLANGRKDYLEAIELLKEARKTGVYYINRVEEL